MLRIQPSKRADGRTSSLVAGSRVVFAKLKKREVGDDQEESERSKLLSAQLGVPTTAFRRRLTEMLRNARRPPLISIAFMHHRARG